MTIAAITLSVSVLADEKSQALLSALQAKVAAWGDYRVEFTVTVDGQSLAGSYEVSGKAYHVVTPDVEIFCDGATMWEVSLLDREVAIDRVDSADRTIMGNPTRLFDFLDGSYTHRYVGAALVNGMNCERIELREAAPGGVGQAIDVFLAAATGLPVRVGYTMGFMSGEAVIDVARITPRVTLDRALFGYDPKRFAGFEMIDFR